MAVQSAVSQAPCSLRLSVRTPPFHGGESGSIPLGSATALDFASPADSAIRARVYKSRSDRKPDHPNRNKRSWQQPKNATSAGLCSRRRGSPWKAASQLVTASCTTCRLRGRRSRYPIQACCRAGCCSLFHAIRRRDVHATWSGGAAGRSASSSSDSSIGFRVRISLRIS